MLNATLTPLMINAVKVRERAFRKKVRVFDAIESLASINIIACTQ